VNTHTNEETNQLLDIIDVFTTKSELATYLILKHLSETNVPVGSWILSDILKSRNLQVSIATIGRLLKNLDTEGYTSLAGTGGRIITPKGLEYLNMLSEKVKKRRTQTESHERVSAPKIFRSCLTCTVRESCSSAKPPGWRRCGQVTRILKP